MTIVRINAGVQIAAAAALATGRAPRLSSAVLAASLLPTTIAGHAFWHEQDPAARTLQRLNFFKGISLVGGLLIAGVDTEGRPGVAWRARRAAKDVRREAKVLARQARAEARVAKAHLSLRPAPARSVRCAGEHSPGEPRHRVRRRLARAVRRRAGRGGRVAAGEQVADQPRAGAGRPRRRAEPSSAGPCARATPC